MLNNKADFILEYNERMTPSSLKRENVDWTQTRVIFVAPEFTKYQQHAIGFKDLGIQLWEVQKYKNNTIIFNEVKPLEATESISTIARELITLKFRGSVKKLKSIPKQTCSGSAMRKLGIYTMI